MASNDTLTLEGFQPVKELGRGAFGVTRLFKNETNGEQIAVKFMKRGKQIAETVQLVEREIKNHMLLVGHPGVVQFKQAFLTRDYLGIAMQYAAGGELFDQVVGHPAGRFPEDVARYFFQQLISAVAWCHDQGVCHRDLKLDNVLLSKPIPPGALQLDVLIAEKPRLMLCDFGYSKCAELDSNPNSLVGTPAYIAPEVYCSNEYNGQVADVWSCGVILYVMLVGAYPFEDPQNPKSSMKRMQAILKGAYQIPAHITLSWECNDLLARIFTVDPAQRITLAQIKTHPWFLRNLLRNQDSMLSRVTPPAPAAQTDEEVNQVIRGACYSEQEAQHSVPQHSMPPQQEPWDELDLMDDEND